MKNLNPIECLWGIHLFKNRTDCMKLMASFQLVLFTENSIQILIKFSRFLSRSIFFSWEEWKTRKTFDFCSKKDIHVHCPLSSPHVRHKKQHLENFNSSLYICWGNINLLTTIFQLIPKQIEKSSSSQKLSRVHFIFSHPKTFSLKLFRGKSF